MQCKGDKQMKVEFSEAQIQLMQTALDKWGLAAQAGQTIEECAELIVALQKHINRKPSQDTMEGIVDEIADVEMMLAQMRLVFGVDDDAFKMRIERKFAKLNEYLEKEVHEGDEDEQG